MRQLKFLLKFIESHSNFCCLSAQGMERERETEGERERERERERDRGRLGAGRPPGALLPLLSSRHSLLVVCCVPRLWTRPVPRTTARSPAAPGALRPRASFPVSSEGVGGGHCGCRTSAPSPGRSPAGACVRGRRVYALTCIRRPTECVGEDCVRED